MQIRQHPVSYLHRTLPFPRNPSNHQKQNGLDRSGEEFGVFAVWINTIQQKTGDISSIREIEQIRLQLTAGWT